MLGQESDSRVPSTWETLTRPQRAGRLGSSGRRLKAGPEQCWPKAPARPQRAGETDVSSTAGRTDKRGAVEDAATLGKIPHCPRRVHPVLGCVCVRVWLTLSLSSVCQGQ